jgi:dienelactone hydrolase
MLEPAEAGFAVQVPNLATTFGPITDSAKRAAAEATQINIETNRETGQRVPDTEPVLRQLKNPDFRDVRLAYVDVTGPKGQMAA